MKSRKELKNMAAVCSNELVTVNCVFTQMKNEVDDETAYTFKATKQFASTLSKLDLVIARKNDGTFAIVQVAEIHDKVIFGQLDRFEYSWIFQKLDESAYNTLYDKETKVVDALEEAQRQNTQRQMIEALGLENDGMKQILLSSAYSEDTDNEDLSSSHSYDKADGY